MHRGAEVDQAEVKGAVGRLLGDRQVRRSHKDVRRRYVTVDETVPHQVETREQVGQVAADTGGDERGDSTGLVDREHARRHAERHTLNPLHDDRGGVPDVRETEQAREALETGERSVAFVFSAKRRVRKVDASRKGHIVLVLGANRRIQGLERAGLAQGVRRAHDGAQSAAAGGGVIHEQNAETAVICLALGLRHAEGLLKALEAHHARAADITAGIRRCGTVRIGARASGRLMGRADLRGPKRLGGARGHVLGGCAHRLNLPYTCWNSASSAPWARRMASMPVLTVSGLPAYCHEL